jgi:anti-anti-sigma factor
LIEPFAKAAMEFMGYATIDPNALGNQPDPTARGGELGELELPISLGQTNSHTSSQTIGHPATHHKSLIFESETSVAEAVHPEFAPRTGTTTIDIPNLFSVQQGTALKQRVQELFETETDLGTLYLNFCATQFMDSSGLGALVACHKICEAHQARMVLQSVAAPVRLVLTMTQLDQVFAIEELPGAETLPNAKDLELDQVPSTHPSVHSKRKRIMDISGAIVGLVITGVVFVPIAIAIKLEDGGPLFFGQSRCSWMGRPFKMWKFRSMVINAEARKHEVVNEAQGALFKNTNDPRITPIGRLLRRTSLDELPQFLNVLRGDMSLVGTRPPTFDEVEQYEINQWQRLDIKPGMTGEWQVNGRSTVKNFEDVVKLDLKYQENWSLMYDVKLIVQTIVLVFNKKKSGAC